MGNYQVDPSGSEYILSSTSKERRAGIGRADPAVGGGHASPLDLVQGGKEQPDSLVSTAGPLKGSSKCPYGGNCMPRVANYS